MKEDEKKLAMKALRKAEKKFNSVINEEMDSSYFRFSAEAKALDTDFEHILWKCGVDETD